MIFWPRAFSKSLLSWNSASMMYNMTLFGKIYFSPFRGMAGAKGASWSFISVSLITFWVCLLILIDLATFWKVSKKFICNITPLPPPPPPPPHLPCLIDMIESMVCQGFGLSNKPNINKIWYENCCREKFHEPSNILLTKHQLHQHVKCLNYRAFACKSTLEANQEIPEVNWHG